MARFVDRGVLGPTFVREAGCGTGPVRTRRPTYIHRQSPCDHVCPVGESVQQWLSLLRSGNLRGAWEVLVRSAPFPAILGRVCGHACESACCRMELDGAIQIRAAEKFLGDLALEEKWTFPVVEEVTRKRALVVGAGPAGLSAAYHLARAGHSVTVFEASSQPGGLMRYGIPKYELPRSVVDAEISRIERLGIRIEVGRRVIDILEERKAGPFDVAFLGVGADEPVVSDLSTAADAQVWDALAWLRQVEDGCALPPGQRVAVWGSGRTAVATARTLRRLGVCDVSLVCRCTRERMSAPSVLLEAARQEGIHFCCETEPLNMEADRLLLQDGLGGTTRWVPMDALIVARGRRPSGRLQQSIAGVLLRENGTLATDERMMSGYPGIYVGGDLASGHHSVAVAAGHGREAAFHMDLYLRETSWAPAPPSEVARFDRLNLWYIDSKPPGARAKRDLTQRPVSFDETLGGLTEEEARDEAGRCLSCGVCAACDGCYASCPESAVVRLGLERRYRFNYDLCTGCAICHDQCPTGAIAMIPEPQRHGAPI